MYCARIFSEIRQWTTFSRLLVSAILFAVSGCNTPHRVEEGRLFRNIGLITSIPETVNIHQGVLHGGTVSASVPWNLNTATLDRLTQALEARYEVRAIASGAQAQFEYVSELATLVGSDGSMAERLTKIVKPGEFDAVLVVTARNGCDITPAFMFLGYRLSLFDGRTLQPLAASNLEVENTRNIEGVDNPHRDFYFKWPYGPFDRLPESFRDQLRVSTLEMISEGLQFSLPKIGLLTSKGR